MEGEEPWFSAKVTYDGGRRTLVFG